MGSCLCTARKTDSKVKREFAITFKDDISVKKIKGKTNWLILEPTIAQVVNPAGGFHFW